MHTVEEVSELFQQYVQALPAIYGRDLQVRTDLATEVVERLKQLSFILSQVQAVQAELGQIAIVETVAENGEKIFVNANIERDQFHFFALRLLTESFYYFAFRIAKICTNKSTPFQELQAFDAAGVRVVRNQLIEHPEGNDSRIFSQVFAFSPGTGMQLKSGRPDGEVGRHEDAGLSANAVEFTTNLGQVLSKALSRLRAPP